MFDRLVYADSDVATGKQAEQRFAENPLATLQLCTAAGSNDLEVIFVLIMELDLLCLTFFMS